MLEINSIEVNDLIEKELLDKYYRTNDRKYITSNR